MNKWKCPKITIGGVPITQQNFSWALIAGVNPYIMSFQIPDNVLHENLKALINPVTMTWEVTGGLRGEPELQTHIFNNLYLLEPKKIDDYNIQWNIADVRWSWRGKKIYCSYNKTRLKNEIGFPPVIGGDITPASLRKNFDTFKVGRYLPWSVMPESEKPWNMRSIIRLELEKLNIPIHENAEADLGTYTVENVELNGVDIYTGLRGLLARSRLQLGIKADGKAYIYSLDYYSEEKNDILLQVQNESKTGPGRLFKQDKSRTRPKKIIVRFEKQMEVRVLASSSEDLPINKRLPLYTNPPVWDNDELELEPPRIIGCENVIQIPFPTKRLGGCQDYQIGEYVPIWEYLKSLNILESDVRKLWFSGLLERKYALQLEAENGQPPSENNERFAQQIIGNIKKHYRQVYQIDPFFVDRMREWSNRRCSIIDNYSHFSPPSPLFADYCVVPKLRHPVLAKRQALWNKSAYNWILFDRDPQRMRPTCGTINIVNQALGIFQVSYPGLVSEVIQEIIPSAVYPEPFFAINSAHPLWDSISLRYNFLLETIISVVWQVAGITDLFHSEKKYFDVKFDYEKAFGPNIEYLSNLEYARYGVNEVFEEYKEFGVIQYSVACLNEGILNNLASSEAAKLYNQFRDQVGGIVTYAGYVNLELFGHMRSVIFSFTPSTGLETTVDMRDMPPSKLLEEIITQDQLDYLKRHVTKRDKNALTAAT